MRLGPAVHRRCMDQRGEVVGDDDHAVVRRRAGVQRRHRALHAHAEGAVPLSPSFPESRRGASDHRRVHHPLQHRVAHRATRPSDTRGRTRGPAGGVTDDTRSHSGVRIDDRGRGRYVGIPLACPKNRERYSWKLETGNRPIRFGEKDTPESLLDLAGRRLEVLHRSQELGTEIVGVEQPFDVPLIDLDTGEVLDRALVGTLDLVERDGSGRLVVVDLKTSARRYTDLQVEASLQLSVYSYAT